MAMVLLHLVVIEFHNETAAARFGNDYASIRALRHGVTDIELELTAFVTAESEAGTIVALNPDIGAELGADVVE